MVKTIIFATANKHKIEEVQGLLGEDFALLSMGQAGITEDIPETADTLEGNALQKALYVFEKTGKACFADDTGLEVDALGGEPGVRSARYAGEQRNGNDNMDLLLQKLGGNQNRRARFRTVIAYIDDAGCQHFFEGVVEGNIDYVKHGDHGFGYDPIFVPKGYKESFAELDLSEKNKISHRGLAMKKFLSFLQNV